MRQYNHYFKDVSHLDAIDVYRVLSLYNVTHPCIQHAVKKLLCAGVRGAKDQRKDWQEAAASIQRALEMADEDTPENVSAQGSASPEGVTPFAGHQITFTPADLAMAFDDGWIEWHGGECPVPVGTMVDIRFRPPEHNLICEKCEIEAQTVYWHHQGNTGDIIAYRLRKPEQPEQLPPIQFAQDREIESTAPEPNWSTAPEWAQWWAVDADGSASWFAEKPIQSRSYSWWGRSGRKYQRAGDFAPPAEWRNTVRQRPQAAGIDAEGGH